MMKVKHEADFLKPTMWTEYRDGKPVAYRYGEDWVAMQLFMEGGFKTKEEAMAAWEKEQEAGNAEKRKFGKTE